MNVTTEVISNVLIKILGRSTVNKVEIFRLGYVH